MKWQALTMLVALAFATAALGSTVHGFRDPKAPTTAATILNSLPSVDNMRCRWKVRGRTIGCVGLVRGLTVQMDVWSGGRFVLYLVCAGGACGKAQRAKHVFGRPY